MAKSRANLTLDPYTHEKAKDVYDNFSQRVEELIEADLDVSQVEDKELLKEEIKKKENELEDVENEISDLEDRRDHLEAELNTAKATLERKEREEKETEQEFDRFKEVFEEQDWRNPEDIPDYWRRELEMSKEELWEEVTE
jgi:chromosome segregation ATPase